MNQIPWSLLCPPTLQACKNLNLQSLQPAHSLLHIKPDFALRITFTLILDGSKSVILFFGILLLMLVLTEGLGISKVSLFCLIQRSIAMLFGVVFNLLRCHWYCHCCCWEGHKLFYIYASIRNFLFFLLVCLGHCLCLFVGQSRFPYHPDQLFDISHVSNIANISVPLITRGKVRNVSSSITFLLSVHF